MSGSLGAACRVVVARDLMIAARRPSDVLTTFFFFVIVVSLFPLGVGAQPDTLREIAPGVVWVAALLAALLSLARMFDSDYADGTLEQLLLAPQPLSALVVSKMLAHWVTSGLPLVIIAPLLGLQFDLPGQALKTMLLSLLIGTPALSLIGALGAALTLGVRGSGALSALLVLPLYVPVLVFGAGAVSASAAGMNETGHLSLLAAMSLAALVFAPWATAMALKISLE